VSLDSIVYAFLSGQSAGSIAQSFPVLRLEQVYGAIAFSGIAARSTATWRFKSRATRPSGRRPAAP
jgi:hypothetical protein